MTTRPDDKKHEKSRPNILRPRSYMENLKCSMCDSVFYSKKMHAQHLEHSCKFIKPESSRIYTKQSALPDNIKYKKIEHLEKLASQCKDTAKAHRGKSALPDSIQCEKIELLETLATQCTDTVQAYMGKSALPDSIQCEKIELLETLATQCTDTVQAYMGKSALPDTIQCEKIELLETLATQCTDTVQAYMGKSALPDTIQCEKIELLETLATQCTDTVQAYMGKSALPDSIQCEKIELLETLATQCTDTVQAYMGKSALPDSIQCEKIELLETLATQCTDTVQAYMGKSALPDSIQCEKIELLETLATQCTDTVQAYMGKSALPDNIQCKKTTPLEKHTSQCADTAEFDVLSCKEISKINEPVNKINTSTNIMNCCREVVVNIERLRLSDFRSMFNVSSDNGVTSESAKIVDVIASNSEANEKDIESVTSNIGKTSDQNVINSECIDQFNPDNIPKYFIFKNRVNIDNDSVTVESKKQSLHISTPENYNKTKTKTSIGDIVKTKNPIVKIRSKTDPVDTVKARVQAVLDKMLKKSNNPESQKRCYIKRKTATEDPLLRAKIQAIIDENIKKSQKLSSHNKKKHSTRCNSKADIVSKNKKKHSTRCNSKADIVSKGIISDVDNSAHEPLNNLISVTQICTNKPKGTGNLSRDDMESNKNPLDVISDSIKVKNKTRKNTRRKAQNKTSISIQTLIDVPTNKAPYKDDRNRTVKNITSVMSKINSDIEIGINQVVNQNCNRQEEKNYEHSDSCIDVEELNEERDNLIIITTQNRSNNLSTQINKMNRKSKKYNQAQREHNSKNQVKGLPNFKPKEYLNLLEQSQSSFKIISKCNRDNCIKEKKKTKVTNCNIKQNDRRENENVCVEKTVIKSKETNNNIKENGSREKENDGVEETERRINDRVRELERRNEESIDIEETVVVVNGSVAQTERREDRSGQEQLLLMPTVQLHHSKSLKDYVVETTVKPALSQSEGFSAVTSFYNPDKASNNQKMQLEFITTVDVVKIDPDEQTLTDLNNSTSDSNDAEIGQNVSENISNLEPIHNNFTQVQLNNGPDIVNQFVATGKEVNCNISSVQVGQCRTSDEQFNLVLDPPRIDMLSDSENETLAGTQIITALEGTVDDVQNMKVHKNPELNIAIADQYTLNEVISDENEESMSIAEVDKDETSTFLQPFSNQVATAIEGTVDDEQNINVHKNPELNVAIVDQYTLNEIISHENEESMRSVTVDKDETNSFFELFNNQVAAALEGTVNDVRNINDHKNPELNIVIVDQYTLNEIKSDANEESIRNVNEDGDETCSFFEPFSNQVAAALEGTVDDVRKINDHKNPELNVAIVDQYTLNEIKSDDNEESIRNVNEDGDELSSDHEPLKYEDSLQDSNDDARDSDEGSVIEVDTELNLRCDELLRGLQNNCVAAMEPLYCALCCKYFCEEKYLVAHKKYDHGVQLCASEVCSRWVEAGGEKCSRLVGAGGEMCSRRVGDGGCPVSINHGSSTRRDTCVEMDANVPLNYTKRKGKICKEDTSCKRVKRTVSNNRKDDFHYEELSRKYQRKFLLKELVIPLERTAPMKPLYCALCCKYFCEEKYFVAHKKYDHGVQLCACEVCSRRVEAGGEKCSRLVEAGDEKCSRLVGAGGEKGSRRVGDGGCPVSINHGSSTRRDTSVGMDAKVSLNYTKRKGKICKENTSCQRVKKTVRNNRNDDCQYKELARRYQRKFLLKELVIPLERTDVFPGTRPPVTESKKAGGPPRLCHICRSVWESDEQLLDHLWSHIDHEQARELELLQPATAKKTKRQTKPGADVASKCFHQTRLTPDQRAPSLVNNLYKCNICIKTFPTKQNFIRHVDRYHSFSEESSKSDKSKST